MDLETLAALADEYHLTREARLAKEKEVDELSSRETALKKELIDNISKQQATGVAGKLVRISVVTKPKPSVKDWDALWAYVVRRKRYDLIQRRVSDTAVKEMWADGKEVPGVEVHNVVDISMNRVK